MRRGQTCFNLRRPKGIKRGTPNGGRQAETTSQKSQGSNRTRAGRRGMTAEKERGPGQSTSGFLSGATKKEKSQRLGPHASVYWDTYYLFEAALLGAQRQAGRAEETQSARLGGLIEAEIGWGERLLSGGAAIRSCADSNGK